MTDKDSKYAVPELKGRPGIPITDLRSLPSLDRIFPESCRLTPVIRGARLRVVHVYFSRGTLTERTGWLVTDAVCTDPEKVCIYFDESGVFLDVPAREVVIERCLPMEKPGNK